MKFERGLLLLICVSNQGSHQVDNEIDHAAMSRVLNLANVLQLVIDRFAQGALAKEDLVEHWHELVFHVLPDLGAELHARLPALIEKLFRDGAAVAKECSPKSPRQARRRLPIIGITRSDPHCEQLAAVVDYQMDLEAGEGSPCGSCRVWLGHERPDSICSVGCDRP